jgi:hypothetical protein
MNSLGMLAAVSVAAVFKILIVMSVCQAWRFGDRAAGFALVSFGLAYLTIVMVLVR